MTRATPQEISLQRLWPQLGRELFTLESALVGTAGAHEKPLTEEAGNKEYGIHVRDSNWKEATIIEMISLPKTRDRNDYTPIEVKLTPKQLEGYLFLAQLGQIGGDPLARSVLTSE